VLIASWSYGVGFVVLCWGENDFFSKTKKKLWWCF